jgi:hypothetical protein
MEPNTTLAVGAIELSADGLLTERDLAKTIKVSMEFLQADRSRPTPRIPFIKIGRAVRYAPADVLAYIERCRVIAR